MIELLVALAIGSFLIIGAVTLQSQSRRNFDVNEQQARLQENARYVIAVIEPELQLAGVYGYSQDPNSVMWDNDGGTHAGERVAHDHATPRRDCPTSLTDLRRQFRGRRAGHGDRHQRRPEWDSGLDCAAEGGGQADDTDVLVLRHTAPGEVEPEARSSRCTASASRRRSTRVCSSATTPRTRSKPTCAKCATWSCRPTTSPRIRMAVPGMPSLRMKMLTTVGGVPGFIDQEILRGVEDLQVQFGVDPGDDLDGDRHPRRSG